MKPFTTSRITLLPGEVIKYGNIPLCNFAADCRAGTDLMRTADIALGSEESFVMHNWTAKQSYFYWHSLDPRVQTILALV